MTTGDKVSAAEADIDDELIEAEQLKAPPKDEPKPESESPESEEASEEKSVESPLGEETSEERKEEETGEEGEPTEEPEKTEETESEFDPESIEDPKVKSYVESLEEKVDQRTKDYDELRALQGKQARELGVAREIVTQSKEDFQAEVNKLEKDATETYAAMLNAADLEEDQFKSAEIKANAEDIRLQKRQAIFSRVDKFGRGQEEAFLKSSKENGTDLYQVQPKFDEFCNSIFMNPIQVKMEPAALDRLYSVLINYERGKNVDDLVGKARKEGKIAAAKVVNVAAAPPGTKTKVEVRKPGKDPSGTTDAEIEEMFGSDEGLTFK